MTAVLPRTVVGVFKDPKQAEEALDELRRVGFGPEQVGVAMRQPEPPPKDPNANETKAAEGGVAGALTGGTVGGLLGAAAAALIPGVGAVLGLGLLAAIGTGVAAGAVAGGVLGTLIGLGIPEEDARYYQTELEAGGTLVTVKANERYDEAVAILRRHGAYGKGKPLL
jgi:hypothetical protein